MNNMPHLINGRSNESPLTERGIIQAKNLGRFLLEREIIPTKVFTSPAIRTIQTSKHTLETMNIDTYPIVSADVQELDQGDWTGKNRHEIYTVEVIERLNKLGKNFKAPRGESMYEVGARMFNWIDLSVESENEEGQINRVFVFTHGLAIRCLASYIENWSHEKTYQMKTPNASISLFMVKNKVLELKYIGKNTRLS